MQKKLPKEYFEQEIKAVFFSTSDTLLPNQKKQAAVLKENFSKIGLNISFHATTIKHPTDELMKQYTFKIWSKVVDLSDPVISYGALYKGSPYENEMPEDSEGFNRAYEGAVNQKNIEDRIKALETISTEIEKKALIVPIFERYSIFYTNPKTIKTLGNQTKPMFLDLSLVEMH
jgi:hypothetical protein